VSHTIALAEVLETGPYLCSHTKNRGLTQ